jgi:hypothetical protein
MAPTILPPAMIGTPPSIGTAPRNAKIAFRPPASASSKTFVGRRNKAAERAFSMAISTEPS